MRLHFQSARDLRNLEKLGKSDPYVRVLLSGIEKGRTVTFKNNLNPDWDEVVYVPVHTIREKLSLEVMDEENLGKDRSLGHVEILAGDYVKQDENGEYVAHEQKQAVAGSLRMAGSAQAKGTLNYTCSFYPTYPTWDPEEDEEEKVTTPNGVTRPESVISTTSGTSKGHTRVTSNSSGAPVTRSETAGTITSMKTVSSHRSSENDLAKALERNEVQQDETTPEKKAVEKLRLSADDLQQYGKLRAQREDAGQYGLLSWFYPRLADLYTVSLTTLRIG
jgi:Ca2+-dependent lipid-binding protein